MQRATENGRFTRRFCVAILCLAASVAFASPESRQLVAQGVERLVKREFDAALKLFVDSAAADPADPLPVFFQGAALNRLGRPREALPLLLKADDNRSSHEDVDFEIGWAQLALGQYADAVARLEAYEKAFPGRAKTSEFLGRAYLGLGQFDKADIAFKLALFREPALLGTVGVFQAQLERARGNPAAADAALRNVLDNAPDNIMRPTLRAFLETRLPEVTVETAPGKLAVSALISAGYSDNVLGLGNAIPLPQDITRKSAWFERLSANVVYRQAWTNATLIAGYGGLVDVYIGRGLSRANLFDNFFYLDYLRAFSERVSGSLRVSDEYTLLDGKAFRNQFGLRPAVVFRHGTAAMTELAAAFSRSDYRDGTIAVFNRDGHAVAATATEYFFVNGELLGSVAWTHTRNSTDGSDFSFHGDLLTARATHKFNEALRGEIVVNAGRDRYDHVNSLSREASARRDRSTMLTLLVSQAVSKTVSVFIRYNGYRNRSNVPFYDFEQNVWNVGVSSGF